MNGLAAAAAAVAVWLMAGTIGCARRRLAALHPGSDDRWTPGVAGLPGSRRARTAIAAALAGGLAVPVGPGAVLPAAIVAGELTRRLLAGREARAAAVVQAAIPEVYAAVAGEVRAGRPPAMAMSTAVAAAPGPVAALLAPVVTAARLGGDVATGLRAVAKQPGAGDLAALAACWSVADDVGAGLAAGVQRLAEAQRDRARQRAEVEAQLAGVRATARLLAGLPLIGLLLGGALGADPAGFLLGRPTGAACAVVACLLDVIGLHWTDRIAERARAAL